MGEKEENERTIILLVVAILILTIIITVIYLCYFIDCKNINVISLIISAIFFSVFISLNFLLAIDYFIATEFQIKDSELVTKIFSNFYSYFNRINSIMTSVIFPFMINCFETGYYSTCKIILESIHRIGHPLWKLLKQMHWRVLIIIGVILGIIVVILYYMFKDKYQLEEPLYYFDYFALALNIYSLIKIYINVGYFMVQLFIECKIEGCCCSKFNCNIGGLCNCCTGNQILEKKLYFYSVRLIVNKTEKYLNKIKEANKALEETIKTFNNETNSKFHRFLLDKVNLMKNDLEIYKYENIQNNNIVIGPAVSRPNNLNLNFGKAPQINNLNLNYGNFGNAPPINNLNLNYGNFGNAPPINNLNLNNGNFGNAPPINNLNLNFGNSSEKNLHPKNTETKTLKDKKEEDEKPKIEIKDNEKESEKILAEHIRKYKKATRKIKKLKNLYNDITKEFNYKYYKGAQSSNSQCSFYSVCCCKKEENEKCFKFVKYYFLIAAFFIITLTDILLPITLFDETENTNKNETNITSLINDTISLTENVLTDTSSSNDEETTYLAYGIAAILIALLMAFLVFAITCSYTVVMIFSMNKRFFISRDFLSGKKINDSVSLMKTIKEICGFTFPLCYCNFYFWKFTTNAPIIFYENIHIPDYQLVNGIGLFMIAKLVVVFFSIAIFRCFGGISKISFFKNDLADFNKKIYDDSYNIYLDEQDFNYFIQNNKVYQILTR